MYIKRFTDWITIKKAIDYKQLETVHTNEGEVWWCAIGENVGVEISGKGKEFTRPVIVLKKYGRNAFMGIPTSTKERIGNWYVAFTFKEARQTALLSQARIFSIKRLQGRMGQLTKTEFAKVKEAFASLFY